ncbi:hypothetical protein [Actinocrinis sp.]|uniref:hypothetical protein n=1 Tax=Actinocrinis sp. TaxID=1920516 RepID=UPI002D2E95A4|nr:hypothetical protein [Actinocrinis sp.]HZP54624.1 hypothetical protein [Actinocrinis sp.]
MSALPIWCVTVDEGIREAPDTTAGQWTIALTQDHGAAPTLQILNPQVIPDCTLGFLTEATAWRLSLALQHQLLRALLGRILRKWTRRPGHNRAARPGHSPTSTHRGGWST